MNGGNYLLVIKKEKQVKEKEKAWRWMKGIKKKKKNRCGLPGVIFESRKSKIIKFKEKKRINWKRNLNEEIFKLLLEKLLYKENVS